MNKLRVKYSMISFPLDQVFDIETLVIAGPIALIVIFTNLDMF